MGLLENTLNELYALGGHAAALWVLEDNERACQIYERQSFTLDGKRKSITLQPDTKLWEIRYQRPLLPVENAR